ncbi:unnamed protein product [Owenia fusiformis]|uniref:Uncharacterized protein n=1 Tax=Owenia fusiformis TaxID=6347 RepID=A0A8J1XQ91_OWEFU|nr:unnamed protein product [Owenia fusiformis]
MESDSDESYAEPIATQTENQIFEFVKDLCGNDNEEDFKAKLLEQQSVEGLNGIRDSFYDIARINRPNDIPPGVLITRQPPRRGSVNKNNANSLGNKLAWDIYTLYHFISGAPNIPEMKSILNATKRQHDKTKQGDIREPPQQRTSATNSTDGLNDTSIPLRNDVSENVLVHIITMKEMIVNVNQKLESLDKSYLSLKTQNDTLRRENDKLKEKHESLTDVNLKLRSELKLNKQELQDNDSFYRKQNAALKTVVDKLSNKMDSIDGKLFNLNSQVTKVIKAEAYSDIVKHSIDKEADKTMSDHLLQEMNPDANGRERKTHSLSTDNQVNIDTTSVARHRSRASSAPTPPFQNNPNPCEQDMSNRNPSLPVKRPDETASRFHFKSINKDLSTQGSCHDHTAAVTGPTKPNDHQQEPVKYTSPTQRRISTVVSQRIDQQDKLQGYDESIGDWPDRDHGLEGFDIASRPRIKRVVLARVKKSPYQTFKQVRENIVAYAAERNVTVTFVRGLKTHSNDRGEWYTLRVNVLAKHCSRVMEPEFWPSNITCRPWVSESQRSQHEPEDDKFPHIDY